MNMVTVGTQFRVQVKEVEGLAMSGPADLVLGDSCLSLQAVETGECPVSSVHVPEARSQEASSPLSHASIPACSVCVCVFLYLIAQSRAESGCLLTPPAFL